MELVDMVAWVVLAILVVSNIGILVLLGMLPGLIARGRGHPWCEAVMVGGWAALLSGFVLWPVMLVWAYVDFPCRGSKDGGR